MSKQRVRRRHTSLSPTQANTLSLTAVTGEAEAMQLRGNFQGAVDLYQSWLKSTSSSLTWAAHFNLGVLLKDVGDIAGARNAFQTALVQKPEFSEAEAALASLIAPSTEPLTEMVKLFSLAWSLEALRQTDPDISVLDNTENLRPDWREYWPMRNFLLNTPLDEQSYYGFFSPKFNTKTGLTGADVKRFVLSEPQADVFTFSPQADMGAFFLNVFEQNDVFDPGFLQICEELFNQIGDPVDLRTLVMDSRQIVFSNYIVARPSFWREWLSLCEKIYKLAELTESPLALNINSSTNYPGQVPRKVFIIERIASLLLARGHWNCTPYNTYECAWSALPTANFKDEAILSDALKIAYNETKNIIFTNAYSKLRDKIFQ